MSGEGGPLSSIPVDGRRFESAASSRAPAAVAPFFRPGAPPLADRCKLPTGETCGGGPLQSANNEAPAAGFVGDYSNPLEPGCCRSAINPNVND